MKGIIAIERISVINADDRICGACAYYCKPAINAKTTQMLAGMSGFIKPYC